MIKLSGQLDNRDIPSKLEEIQQVGLHICDVVLANNTEMSWPRARKPSELCEIAVNHPEEVDQCFSILSLNWQHRNPNGI